MRFLGLFLLVIFAAVSAEEAADKCEPGKTFKRYCNTCMCSSEGKVEGCTRMECNHNYWNEDGSVKYYAYQPDWDDYDYRRKRDVEKPIICERGKVKREYCNICVCSDDGTKLHCTNRRCLHGDFDRNGMRPYQHYDLSV